MYKFHKKIRLDRDIYASDGVISSITICTNRRNNWNAIPPFKNRELTTACIEQLKNDAASYELPVFAYCFMPNHLHLVISPGVKKDIVKFVGEYKGRTTRTAWKFGIKGKLWQTSFYDHFLRKEEDIEKVVMYVLNNPVRKGLVSEWMEYHYSGSLVFEL